jgi:anti-anti-sigma regulatory factor
MAFHLELLKEGHRYECFKCTCGAYELRDRGAESLPVEISKTAYVLLVRLRCRNVYIFDREVFNDFTRRISREVTAEPNHVVVDLTEIGYVPETNLGSLVRLRRFLARKGRELRLVQRSEVFRGNLREIDPEADLYLFRSEEEALEKPFPASPPPESGQEGP